jgi:hypothetical protein
MNRATLIRETIDRQGPDFDAWRDSGLAGEARRAVLADRALRAFYDDAVVLSDGLAAARAAADAEAAVSGAIARVETAVMQSLPRRRARRGRWIEVAAALVVAAGLGSAYDLVASGNGADGPVNVVVLDPLVFGPAEVDAQ